MNKPGEYEPINPQSFYEYNQDENGFWDRGVFKTGEYELAVRTAVKQAHSERNCGNCRNWPHERIETIWEENSHCEVTGLFFEDSDAEEKYLKILKCNEWKPKEADNANA